MDKLIADGRRFLFGFLSRLISPPFVVEMISTILSTRISLFLWTSRLPAPPVPPKSGFWAAPREIRTEYAQIPPPALLPIHHPERWPEEVAQLGKRRKKIQLRQAARPVAAIGFCAGH